MSSAEHPGHPGHPGHPEHQEHPASQQETDGDKDPAPENKQWEYIAPALRDAFFEIPFMSFVNCVKAGRGSEVDVMLSFFKNTRVQDYLASLSKTTDQYLRVEAIAETASSVFTGLPEEKGEKRTRFSATKTRVWEMLTASWEFFSQIPPCGASVLWLLPTSDVLIFFILHLYSENTGTSDVVEKCMTLLHQALRQIGVLPERTNVELRRQLITSFLQSFAPHLASEIRNTRH